jgi:hypothetical protein
MDYGYCFRQITSSISINFSGLWKSPIISNVFFYYHIIPTGFSAIVFHPIRRRSVRRTGWFSLRGGAKRRGGWFFIEHKFYKRVIPTGLMRYRASKIPLIEGWREATGWMVLFLLSYHPCGIISENSAAILFSFCSTHPNICLWLLLCC